MMLHGKGVKIAAALALCFLLRFGAAWAQDYDQVQLSGQTMPVMVHHPEGEPPKAYLSIRDIFNNIGCPYRWKPDTRSIPFECPTFQGEIFLTQEKVRIGDVEYDAAGEIALIQGTTHIAPELLMRIMGLRSRLVGSTLVLESANAVTRLEPLPGERIGVRIGLREPEQYSQFMLQHPDRLVIDIKNVILAAPRTTVEVDRDPIIRIRSSQFDHETVRIVVDLNRPVGARFELGDQGREIIVEFAAVLSRINVDRVGSAVTVALHLSDQLQNMDSFELRAPDRLVIDLTGVQVGERLDHDIPVDIPPILKVRSVQNQLSPPVARVVIDFHVIPAYRIDMRDNGRRINVVFTLPALFGKHIAVDPGHGGKDPGAVSGGMLEKDAVLKMSLMLAEYLRQVGAKVTMIRSADVFVSLDDRARIANRAGVDAFVSVHANALPQKPEHSGTEVYYFGEEGKVLAEVINPMLVQAAGLPDRGVKRARFYVLRNTAMAAVLLEIGFLTNHGDRLLLQNETFLRNTAVGTFNGLEAYFGGEKLLRFPSRIGDPALDLLVVLPMALDPEVAAVGAELDPGLPPVRIGPAVREREAYIHRLAEEIELPDVQAIRQSLRNQPLDDFHIEDIPEDLREQIFE